MLDLSQFNPSHLWLSFEKSLQSNQFLASGLVLGGVGIMISLARGLPKKIGLFLFERCIVCVQLIEPDDSFEWFQAWLFEQPVRLRMRDLAMATINRRGHYDENEVKKSNVGFSLSLTQSDAPRGIFTPRKGTFNVEFEGRTFWVTADTNERSNRRPSVSFTIRTLITNRDAFERLMQAAYQTVFNPEEKK